MSINHLKISTKLILGFGLMTVFLLVISGVAIFTAKNLNQDFQSAIYQQYPRVVKIEEIKELLNTNEVSISHMLHYKESASHEDLIDKVLKTRSAIGAALAFLDQQTMGAEERQILEAFKGPRQEYLEVQDKYIDLVRKQMLDDALFVLILEMPSVREKYHQALVNLVEVQNKLMNHSVTAATQSVNTMFLLIGGATVLVLLGGIGLAWWIIQSITRPISTAVGVAYAVADGKLTQTIEVSGKNETAQLLRSLQQMQMGLAQVVGKVRHGSAGIASASEQISQGNQDLSARTENQASALQHTSATMEQLSVTVQKNAESAQQANQLAQTASGVAQQGGAAMAAVVQTMAGIQDSAHRIADIIGVIDGIAFQTNILALNAAVEAARAGEQGRGFAVVAAEVRSLAGRSADAAREIKTLIQASVQGVATGTQEVHKTGHIMDEVVQAIAKVAHIMQDITSASTEQSQGVQEVSQSVVQMDQATQQNAALVEEMAAAAWSLNQQAQTLVDTVAVFEVAELQNPPPPAHNQALVLEAA